MRRLKGWLLPLIAVFVLAVAAVPLTVYAEEVKPSEGGDRPVSSNTAPDESQGDTFEQRKERAEKLKANIQEQTEKNREKAQDLLKDAREKYGTKSAEERQAACERRKSGLQQKVDNLEKNGDKYLARVDEVFAKAQSFQEQNNLNVPAYDQLVAEATAAQTQAAASVDSLKELKPTIDCTSNTVAADVAAFKAAATQARNDLKEYRMDVKALLTALKEAKEAQE